MKNLSNHIKESFLNENWVDDIHKKQDDFVKKMIKEWKSNKDLKVFDKYFQWKTHEIKITDLTKSEVQEMRSKAQEMLNKLWDDNNDDLAQIVEAIEGELLNMILIGKLK